MPSVPTIRKIIARHPNFPIIARGTRGRSYEIDLEEAEEFIRQVQAGRIMDIERRRQALREMGLTESLRLEMEREARRNGK
ncbi:hypothetical protein CV103_11350 [Sphingomonas fennica]|uniref:Uncharacterized protein n=2 Tax=Edaphosphingomonas fennica TaxID=114404 RepID=A0A2T4HX87_9SPHN|nr:hypothetical protein CV103_11350 [Sphingomonas fennica]